MRNLMKAEANKHTMVLKQLGAKVDVINSFMCYVTVNIEGIDVAYVYNINHKNKYFLERIKPYSEAAGTFKNEEDVIDAIKTDIEQFKNAKKCNVFNLFIDINKKMSNTIREFEDLYLYYNVPHEYAEEIRDKIKEIQSLISNAKENSERVFHKKDPDHI